MNKQNPSVPLSAWWCLIAAGIAACGVTLGDVPLTTSAALLLVMIALVPAAVMLVLWREAPESATPGRARHIGTPAVYANVRRLDE